MLTIGDAWAAIESDRKILAFQIINSDSSDWPNRLAALAAHLRFIQNKTPLTEGALQKSLAAALDIIGLERKRTTSEAAHGMSSAITESWDDIQIHLRRIESQLPEVLKIPSRSLSPSAGGRPPRLEVRMLSDSTPLLRTDAEYRFKLSSSSAGRLLPSALTPSFGSLVHVLVVDQHLSDYQHCHPVSGDLPGEWKFQFSPKTSNAYRAFIQVTPKQSGTVESIPTNLTQTDQNFITEASLKQEKLSCSLTQITGVLEFPDTHPVPGAQTTCRILIRKHDSNASLTLDSEDGYVAKLTVFSENLKYARHLHSMLAQADASAPSRIEFAFAPPEAGFYRIFADLRVDGAAVQLQFGVLVKPVTP